MNHKKELLRASGIAMKRAGLDAQGSTVKQRVRHKVPSKSMIFFFPRNSLELMRKALKDPTGDHRELRVLSSSPAQAGLRSGNDPHQKPVFTV